jgi:predicted TIM-barrel fold metal-dependent hydrolase
MEDKITGCGTMIDNHVHIGQFEEVYYDPLEVVDIVMTAAPRITGFAFSSTSSCTEDVSYIHIEKEIADFLARMPYASEAARPFFWFIPDYIKQGVNIESALSGIPYKGIKLHPYAQKWDFENSDHLEALGGLFDYAATAALPVLIHTGHSGIDSADRFERFFSEYRDLRFVLAHCRPLDAAVRILETYANVSGDTAFMPEEDTRYLADHGLGHKIIFGTDFPITHYFRTHFPKPGEKADITLREQYAEDAAPTGFLKEKLKT